jgi:hypothetical protein
MTHLTSPTLRAGPFLSPATRAEERYQERAVEVGGRLVEAAEDDAVEGIGVRATSRTAISAACCLGIAVDAGGDRGKGDALQAVLLGKRQAVAVAPASNSGSFALPPCQTGPTVWMTCRAFSR